jgi:hypothetical protein
MSNYEIDGYKINKYSFVKNYTFTHCKPELFIENFIPDTISEEIEYYYIFDSPCKDAFGHWFYESFIFYPIFLSLQKIYPTIKIVVNNNKRYIKNFFNFVGIDLNLINNFIQKENNICFFNPLVSLNVSNNQTLELIKEFSLKMRNFIKSNINYMSIKNKIILLPRDTKDNYTGNERMIHGIEDIESNVISKDGTVINTFNLNNIHIQFSLINSFENIIVCYGSGYTVNCLFLKNKNIIVLDNYNYHNNHKTFEANRLIYDLIEKENNVVYVPPSSNNSILYKDLEKFII